MKKQVEWVETVVKLKFSKNLYATIDSNKITE